MAKPYFPESAIVTKEITTDTIYVVSVSTLCLITEVIVTKDINELHDIIKGLLNKYQSKMSDDDIDKRIKLEQPIEDTDWEIVVSNATIYIHVTEV